MYVKAFLALTFLVVFRDLDEGSLAIAALVHAAESAAQQFAVKNSSRRFIAAKLAA